jgi:RNA polymerase sigma-70 factor, ECF subfamily
VRYQTAPRPAGSEYIGEPFALPACHRGVQDALTVALPRLEAPWAYHGRVQIAADEVLAKRAADGDESAFEELVVRYQDRLYTLALRITLSDADAYDCVQEGLVAAWRGLGSFRFDARFSTWIHRIVVRKAYDVLERRARIAEPVDEVPAVSVDSPADDRLDLLSALAQLDPEFRVVAVACDVVGLSMDEAAAVLDLPAGTVKSRLHRARARLAEALQTEAAP